MVVSFTLYICTMVRHLPGYFDGQDDEIRQFSVWMLREFERRTNRRRADPRESEHVRHTIENYIYPYLNDRHRRIPQEMLDLFSLLNIEVHSQWSSYWDSSQSEEVESAAPEEGEVQEEEEQVGVAQQEEVTSCIFVCT